MQGRILQQMKIKGLKQHDLAKLTGYKLSTIQAFMSETGNKSERVAEAICKVLEIER